MRLFLTTFIVCFFTLVQNANCQDITYVTTSRLSYYSSEDIGDDAYKKEMCVLDIYYPTNIKNFATVVWFHGGGLTGGERDMPKELLNQGFAVISVGYRLSPKVSCPAYINDAAAAVAWVFKNVDRLGGSSSKVYISGHSAGGYLAMMVGMDSTYLAKYGVSNRSVAALIPLSGQAITHFTIRKEMGIADKQPVVDGFAPLFHVDKHTVPLYLITGDRDMELLGRYEENAYLWRMMKECGNQTTFLYELDGFNHGDMVSPGATLLAKIVKSKEATKNK